MALVRRGGESEKVGYTYEEFFRLTLVLEVIEKTAEQVTFESFDRSRSAGVDAEVIRRKNGRFFSEYYSVKRQTAAGKWTVEALTSGGRNSIVGQLIGKLSKSNQDERGVFVTSSHVPDLRDLAQEIRERCRSLDVFQKRLDAGSARDRSKFAAAFEDFRESLGLEKGEAFSALHSLQFAIRSPSELEDDAERAIRRSVMQKDGLEADESAVATHLTKLMDGNLGIPIDRSMILAHLDMSGVGYCEQNLSAVEPAKTELKNQNSRFIREAEEALIRAERIERREVADIFEKIQQNNRVWISLTGDAGCGKSCILAQLVDRARRENVPVLSFRFDTATPVDSLSKLSEFLSLSWRPVPLLEGLASRGRSLLVVDQVDALSVLSGRRNAQQWNVLHQVIEEARQCPNMSIVLACRSFDLRNDPKIRSLLDSADQKGVDSAEIKVGLLPIEIVQKHLCAEGISTKNWSETNLNILRTPLHLRLFFQCSPQDKSPVESLPALYRRYFLILRQKASTEASSWNFDDALGKLVDCFEAYQAVAVDWTAAESRNIEEETERLVSCGVLTCFGEGENRVVRFFHDTLFDYAFAVRFVKEGTLLRQYIGGPNVRQDLFRRTQCRQVLAYLRAGSPKENVGISMNSTPFSVATISEFTSVGSSSFG